MTFSFQNEELAQPITFASAAEVAEWAKRELDVWSGIQNGGTNTAEKYLRTVKDELQRLQSAATASPPDTAKIEQLLQALSRDLKIAGTGPRGRVFTALRRLGYEPKAVGAAVAAALKPEELRNLAANSYLIYDVIVGISAAISFEAGGNAVRLIDLLNTIDKTEAEWHNRLEEAAEATRANVEAHDSAVRQLQETLTSSEGAVKAAVSEFATQMAEIRARFEEQFALRTPMTYWNEKADRHKSAAVLYRKWFSVFIVGGGALLAVAAYFALVPFMNRHPTAYWAVVLFSVCIALLAWPLRIASKQYLLHQQLFEDAAERAVIAKTFLALGEQVKLTDADRQILLGALMRPAGVSLVSDESGGINVADVIMAKTLTRS